MLPTRSICEMSMTLSSGVSLGRCVTCGVFDNIHLLESRTWHELHVVVTQGLTQDLENGCSKFATVRFLGILFFKGINSIFRLQP